LPYFRTADIVEPTKTALSDVYINIIKRAQSETSLNKLTLRSKRTVEKSISFKSKIPIPERAKNLVYTNLKPRKSILQMAEADLQNLIQQTFSHIHEMYNNRPVNLVSSPPLLPYTGDGDVNWGDYERQFSNMAVLVGATDLPRKTALLSTYLRGAAQTLFTELSQRTPALTTWDEWKAEFTTRFPDDQHIDIKRDQLVARAQKVGEPVLQFAADVRHLARRAQPGWTGYDTNDFIKSHFISKLLPNLRLWVRNASPKNFEAAVAEAHKHEINQMYENTNNNNDKNQANIINLLSSLSLGNPCSHGSNSAEHYSSNSQNRSDRQFSRQTPLYQNGPAQGRSEVFDSSERGSARNRNCYFCGRFGHFKAHCRERKDYLDSLHNNRFDQSRDRYRGASFNNRTSFDSPAKNRHWSNQGEQWDQEERRSRPTFSRNDRLRDQTTSRSRTPSNSRYQSSANHQGRSRDQRHVQFAANTAMLDDHSEQRYNNNSTTSRVTDLSYPILPEDPDLISFFPSLSLSANICLYSLPLGQEDGRLDNLDHLFFPDNPEFLPRFSRDDSVSEFLPRFSRDDSVSEFLPRSLNRDDTITEFLPRPYGREDMIYSKYTEILAPCIYYVYMCNYAFLRKLMSYRFSFFTYFFLYCIICSDLFDFSVALPVQNGSIFYKCDSREGGHPISVPSDVFCDIPTNLHENSLVIRIHLWGHNTKPQETSAIKCILKISSLCTFCGFFNSKSVLSQTNIYKSVTKHECLFAWKSKQFERQPLVQKGDTTWTTENFLSLDYKWCCAPFCRNATNFIIDTGLVSTFDGLSLLTDLGHPNYCNISDKSCYSDEFIIVWETDNFKSYCPFMKLGTYPGKLQNRYVVIEQIQGAFTLKLPVYLCGRMIGYETEQGSLLQLEYLRDNEWRALTPTETGQPKLDPSIDTGYGSVDAKLQFLYEKIRSIETYNFRVTWLELCKGSSRFLHLVWQILRLDPTLGARVLLNTSRIHADFFGEVLVIWQCSEVHATEIFWNYTVADKCYRFLPIRVGAAIFFVVPGSRDVVSSAPLIDCRYKPLGVHKIQNSWTSNKGKIHVSEPSIQLIWNNHWVPYTFNASPKLFQQHTQIQYNLQLLNSYFIKTHMLEGKLNRLVNYTASMSFDPEVLSRFIHSSGDIIQSTLIDTSHFLLNGTENIFGSVSHLLGGNVQFFINLFVFGIFGILLVYSCSKCNILTLITSLCLRRNLISRHSSHTGARFSITDNTVELLRMPQSSATDQNSSLVQLLRNTFASRSAPRHEDTAISCTIEVERLKRTPLVNALITNVTDPTYSGTTTALIDTGSEVTLIRKDLAHDLNFVIQDVGQISLTQASGQQTGLIGSTWMILQFPGANTFPRHKELLRAFVIDTCPTQLLLGTDFLCRYTHTTCLWSKPEILFGSHRVPLLYKLFLDESQRGFIHIQENVQVPAFTSMLIHVTVPVQYQRQDAIQFEPIMDNTPLFIASSIAKPDDGKIPINILNASSTAITLYKFTNIGKVWVYREPVCCSAQAVGQQGSINPTIDISRIQIESTLQDDDKNKLLSLINNYATLFVQDDNDLGRTSLVSHTIDTGDHPPIKQQPYRTAQNQRAVIETEVQKMLDKGVIRLSQSPWSSPVVLVPKKTGGFRFCIDYRKLNAATKKDSYPLPRIDDILETLNKCVYFSTLDQAAGYWQIPVDETDKEKTAFITYNGLYEFNVVPFGLCNAPATFQRLMNLLLAGLHWQICLVYLDDILIFSRTFEEHLCRLKIVFDKLQGAGLKLRLDKCHFAKAQTSYLGYVISAKGIAPDPKKVEAVKIFRPPKDVSGVKSFLGLASYYRKFIANFAQLAAPLNDLLKKHVKFHWSKQCQSSFEALQTALITAPVLKFPNFSESFLLQTDASGIGLGVVLAQQIDGEEHPIAYASRTLKPAERNYPVFEQEALAVVWGFQQFRTYLSGHKTTVITDHSALQYILKKNNPSPRIARWGLALQEYEFEVRHRAGRNHTNVDALSRLCCQAESSSTDATQIQLTASDENGITAAQNIDPFCQMLMAFLTKGELPDRPQDAKFLATHGDNFSALNGTLYYLGPNQKGVVINERLVVPPNLQQAILEAFHDDVFAGHLGFFRTLNKIRDRYYWRNMYSNIKSHVLSCTSCCRKKLPTKTPRAPLVNIPVGGPFDRIASDVLGPLPVSTNGNKYIIVFTDYLTKYCMTAAIPNVTANLTAKLFVRKVVLKHGAPLEFLTDQGTNYTAQLIKEICEICSTRKLQTTPYHPQTDGLVERFNKTLTNMLSNYVNATHTDWDTILPYVTFAYNTTKQASTNFSPFFLLYGREARLPIDVSLQLQRTTYFYDGDDYAMQLRDLLSRSYQLAQQNIQKAQNKQKLQYDKKVSEIDYEIGDIVYKRVGQITPGTSPKFSNKYDGPYTIKNISYPNVTISNSTGKTEIVHVNRIKLGPKSVGIQNCVTHIQGKPDNSTNSNLSKGKPANNLTTKASEVSCPYNLRSRK